MKKHQPRRATFLCCAFGVVLFFWQGSAAPLAAQEEGFAPPDRFRESASVETSRQAARQLSTVALHARDGRWQEAISELERVVAAEGDSLVALAPGRYLNVRMYANLLVSSFPAEGLAAYRKSIDPQARLWYETGRTSSDEASLRRVVHKAFVSSYGDDTLFLLGEQAWERGEIGTARRFWEQMLPLTSATVPGELKQALHYPDTDHDHADILARLILCSVVEKNVHRAELELAAFSRMFPDAKGTLAGRPGVLAETLREILQEAHSWKSLSSESPMQTFAVNSQRCGILSREVEIGAARWRTPLDVERFLPDRSSPHFDTSSVLRLFPVPSGNGLFFNDSQRIYAYDLQTGQPLWPNGENNSAAIYEAADGRRNLFDGLLMGTPRYTLSVSEGRLYARMGSPITGQSARELRSLENHLVCLDIDRGEGKLLWKAELKGREAGWAFEGSPTITGGRLYVPLRRGFPQTQTNVACLDAATGEFVWNRQVCAAVSDASQIYNLVSHHLLTIGANSVFYSTDMGAIAALDADDGTLRWVTTYESTPSRSSTESAGASEQNLTPCLYHDGVVVAAPSDNDGLMVLDALTGAIRWQRILPGGIRHLMGVHRGRLIVSGDALWGIDLGSGSVIWQIGASDPVSHGYGQGLLAGNLIYWPTREELIIVDQVTGGIQRRVPLSAMHGTSGGNLAMTANSLIIAGPDEIVVFGEYSRMRSPSTQWISVVRREK